MDEILTPLFEQLAPPATLREALARYERLYMPERNFAPKTRREYAADLGALVSFFERGGRTSVVQLSLSDLGPTLPSWMPRAMRARRASARPTWSSRTAPICIAAAGPVAAWRSG